jgi:hypothetical protein
MELCPSVTRTLELGKELVQWLYKVALVGHTRILVTNIDKAGTMLCTTSCQGGTGEVRAKNCTGNK